MIARDVHGNNELTSNNLLEIRELSIYIKQVGREKLLLDRVRFQIKEGKFTALMGRSGIGKSLTIKAILGLLKEPWWRLEGDIIEKRGRYLIKNGKYNWPVISELRGKNIFTIFQGPDSHLHPSLTVGWQIGEAIDYLHPWENYEEVAKRLKEVGLDPWELKKYPHQFAQGQRQRIMIAMALSGADLIIADEPTSALDPEFKENIIYLLKELRTKGQIKSMLLVTHDLRVIESLFENDDIIYVLDSTERGTVTMSYSISIDGVKELRKIPRNYFVPIYFPPLLENENFTWFKMQKGLVGFSGKKPILSIKGLRQGYRQGIFGRTKVVLDAINLEAIEGEILGIVGKSGCGKTTLVKSIARLLDNTNGKVYFWPNYQAKQVNLVEIQPDGSKADSDEMRKIRKEIQVIFQDSTSIFNPKMTIRELLNETLEISRVENEYERAKKIKESLFQVGICRDEGELEDILSKYPGELSGGERQRLAIARVFLLRPRLVIADEPFADQDKITKEEILKMMNIMNKNGTTFIIISHDLNLVEGVCDRVAIMKDGRIINVITQKEIK